MTTTNVVRSKNTIERTSKGIQNMKSYKTALGLAKVKLIIKTFKVTNGKKNIYVMTLTLGLTIYQYKWETNHEKWAKNKVKQRRHPNTLHL
jgi:hypothetical protein